MYFIGYERQLEWNVYTGHHRRVYKFFGVVICKTDPRDNPLSKWRDLSVSDQKWVKIASGPHHLSLVNYGFVQIYNHLNRMELFVEDEHLRKVYASLLLKELELNGLSEMIKITRIVTAICIEKNIQALTSENLNLILNYAQQRKGTHERRKRVSP